jgi:hypothetical protein
MIDDVAELSVLQEEWAGAASRVENCEGARLSREWHPLTITHDGVFRSNLRELLDSFDRYADDEFRTTLWVGGGIGAGAKDLDVFLWDLFRRLHNFVASVRTLRDHTRNVVKRLYGETPFWDEYQNQVTSTFDESDLSRFVQGMANYFLHYNVPVVLASSGGVLTLDTTMMRGWDGWSSGARAYLDEQPQWVTLRRVIEEYAELIEEFYSWLNRRHVETSDAAFHQFEELKRELAVISAKLQEARG